MAAKKFPLGTTVYYIDQLRSLNDSAISVFSDIAINYESLTFGSADTNEGSKFSLLQALLQAVGTLKTEGNYSKNVKSFLI